MEGDANCFHHYKPQPLVPNIQQMLVNVNTTPYLLLCDHRIMGPKLTITTVRSRHLNSSCQGTFVLRCYIAILGYSSIFREQSVENTKGGF